MRTIEITIPEELRDKIQKYDTERSARRDVIVYILSNDGIEISNERFEAYQKDYDNKFFAFESAKNELETMYVQPAVNNKALNWNLNYQDCKVTITIDD